MKFIEVFADVTLQGNRCTFLLKPFNAQRLLYVLFRFNIQKVFVLPTKCIYVSVCRLDMMMKKVKSKGLVCVRHILYWTGWGEERQLSEGSQASPARPSHKGSMKICEEDVRMLTVAG